MKQQETLDIRPDVLNVEDVCQLAPALGKHRKLVKWLLHFLAVDKVNDIHRRFCDTPGPEFATHLVVDGFKLKLTVDNAEVLDNLPEGAFITVSNHPFGALDGIVLIHLFASRRPKFRVMVNMILNKISAMRPNFIAVDQSASSDPEKRKVSVNGIRQVLSQLRDGEPIGFFPAGAMSKVNWHLRLQDRPWQDSVLQLIYRAKVPVIPVFFHGTNSWWFNFLGVVCWQARTLRLPAEVFRKTGKKMRVTIGEPISVEQQKQFDSPAALGEFLRKKTYALRSKKTHRPLHNRHPPKRH